MGRTIDGDDFLKQSTELYEFAGWDEREVHFSLADLRCNLEMMPTVEAEPKWIPVTERLPEHDDYVLISTIGGFVTIDRYLPEDGEWYECEAIAWMPLPEPYEVKEE